MAILDDTFLANMGTLAINLAAKDTCDILRNPHTPDAQGGYSSTSSDWPAVATGLPCLVVDSRFPAEQVVAEQLTDRMDKIISLPRLTDVQKTDRIKVYQTNGATTKYHVLGVVEPSTYEVLRRVVVTREDVPVA